MGKKEPSSPKKESSELRDIGNKAFKNGDYDKAIASYTKALDLNPNDAPMYSNRSAAYLKKGDNSKALRDAEQCIQLQPTFHKGYSRKGAAHHAMKQYNQAIATYRLGLTKCPKVEALEKGLASSNRAKNEYSKARTAARKSNAARKASTNQQTKARRATNVSSYVEQKRLELRLQRAALEAQLDFIEQLTAMTDEEKLDLLFNVIDDDNNGYIDAKELASAMRRRNADMTFSASLEKAIDMVAIFDTDGDARLNLDEFEGFLQVMLKELNVSFNEFAEYMVLQTMFSDKNEPQPDDELDIDKATLALQVKERGTLLEMLADPRLMEIFDLFDREGTRELTFKEVAIGLYQLTSDMEQSAKTTMELLLMMDKEDKRTVNYEQFGRLMMGVMSTLGHNKSFDEVADELVLALTSNTTISEDDMTSLIVADTVFTDFQMHNSSGSLGVSLNGSSMNFSQSDMSFSSPPASSRNNKTPEIDNITYGRLQKLFDLWDTNGDGTIDDSELQSGFSRFEQSSGVPPAPDLQQHVFMGTAFGRHEFANAMARYAVATQVDLHQLIDFMCLTAVLPPDRAEAYSQAYRASYAGGSVLAAQPMHLQYEFVEFD